MTSDVRRLLWSLAHDGRVIHQSSATVELAQILPEDGVIEGGYRATGVRIEWLLLPVMRFTARISRPVHHHVSRLHFTLALLVLPHSLIIVLEGVVQDLRALLEDLRWDTPLEHFAFIDLVEDLLQG